MEKKTLEILFTNKTFFVPNYQRDYAWRSENVSDLFDDIREAIETGTQHYIGTFILSKASSVTADTVIDRLLREKTDCKDGAETASALGDGAKRSVTSSLHAIVDGQQRLTTLSMVIHALVSELDIEDDDRIVYERRFLRSRRIPHLILHNGNHDFFYRLVHNAWSLKPLTRGQRLLREAYEDITRYIQSLKKDSGDDGIRQWLEAIKDLEVLEFIEEDEGRAIRIFLTVNDRGVGLTNMDKAKSLLVYYSNRFLDSKLDQTINECFGEAYRAYDAIKELSESDAHPIDLIKARTFNEDTILRWHFVSFESPKWTYEATESYVLNSFLRLTLKEYLDNRERLREFIQRYVRDLRDFFLALRSVVQRMKWEPKYFKLFAVLGPSTNMYPLLVRMEMRRLLDEEVPGDPRYTFIDLIEVADLRIYKVRGRGPSKDISSLAREASVRSAPEISQRLWEIVQWFMSNAEFEKRLGQDVYPNPALVHIFFALDELLLNKRAMMPYSMADLVKRKGSEPTIEHIFSQEPCFDFPGHGFQSMDEYSDRNNKLGNLLVLEKSLNGRCNNRTMEDKVREPDLYAASDFEAARQFRQERKGSFTVAELDRRTRELVHFCLDRWPLWTSHQKINGV